MSTSESKLRNSRHAESSVHAADILQLLASRPNPKAVAGMARFGIVAEKIYGGWSVPDLRKLARQVGRNHALAQELWAPGIFEARLLATLVDEPQKVTSFQMNQWVKDLDNWAICDGACINLFRNTPHAWKKCVEWSRSPREFIKRAAFSLMAGLTVADKAADDAMFLSFLPLILSAARDERNMVKKGVNWALRQIGKRNLALNQAALKTIEKIQDINLPTARWIASDAKRELQSSAVQSRLKKQGATKRGSKRKMAAS